MPESREIVLVCRPEGLPKPTDFALTSRSVAMPQPGEVLIRQLWMSVDPAMRPRLSSGYRLGEVMPAFALGRIAASRHPDWAEGTLVHNHLGWREFAVSDGSNLRAIAEDPAIPTSAHLSVLGATGFTAWGGLLAIGRAQPGERVFVSTAAGAVGSIAIQIARNLGCAVCGSTGSDEKAAWLRDSLGIARVINYRTSPIGPALAEAMPDGIDVYFDNVGGDHLDAALPLMRELGRVAVCGMIAGYNRAGATVPVNNLAQIIYRRVTLRGFVGTDFADQHAQFDAEMRGWLRDGRIQWRETITDGLERAPDALIGVLQGKNTGKALVRIAPE